MVAWRLLLSRNPYGILPRIAGKGYCGSPKNRSDIRDPMTVTAPPDNSHVSHLECSATGERYENDRLHGLEAELGAPREYVKDEGRLNQGRVDGAAGLITFQAGSGPTPKIFWATMAALSIVRHSPFGANLKHQG